MGQTLGIELFGHPVRGHGTVTGTEDNLLIE